MKKYLASTFTIASVVALVPLNAYATLMNYNVSGTLENDDVTLTISGNIVIDDTLKLWGGGPAPTELTSSQYSYLISEYSFTLTDASTLSTDYSFSGIDGSFYMERTSSDMGDLMWFLKDGTGDWNRWTGETFQFYHGDMSSYDLFNEMDTLAPIIRLSDLTYLANDPILGSWINADILLTQTVPIPEANTLLLFGMGLTALLWNKQNNQTTK